MNTTESTRSNASSIVGFFRNLTPDDSGRMFREILAWPDEPLEYTHDFIQWLFPLAEKSPVNPDAPTVDDETRVLFQTDPALREALADAFRRMARFYGLEIQDSQGKIRVTKSPDWPMRSANWLTRGNHNLRRITRIIKSLRLLGLDPTAQAFFVALDELYHTGGADAIGATTYAFWKSAATESI